MENCLGFSLFLVCILVGKGVDAQSTECQSAYNAFQSLSETCQTALSYATSGNPLVPLQSTFSDSQLDTLCSSSCLTEFTAYFSECITQGSSPGATDFITGEFTDTSDAKAEMLNAICRRDCASSSETYCYSTVLATLHNTTCDSSTTTCSGSCQTALDNGGCCAQAVFKFKNPSVTVCTLCSFTSNCFQFTVTCPADAPCSGTIAPSTTTVPTGVTTTSSATSSPSTTLVTTSVQISSTTTSVQISSTTTSVQTTATMSTVTPSSTGTPPTTSPSNGALVIHRASIIVMGISLGMTALILMMVQTTV